MNKVALVVGAGDATGGAIARRFARDGLVACVTRRHADKLVALETSIEAACGICHAFGSDARDEEQVVKLFADIESAIDTAFIAKMFPDKYRQKDQDGILDPVAIADAYGTLHRQPRSAWTHELDLRPWMEKW